MTFHRVIYTIDSLETTQKEMATTILVVLLNLYTFNTDVTTSNSLELLLMGEWRKSWLRCVGQLCKFFAKLHAWFQLSQSSKNRNKYLYVLKLAWQLINIILEFFKSSFLYSVRKNSKVDFSQKKFFSKIATSLKSTFFRL